MNLETKIICRQVQNGPNLDQTIFCGCNNHQCLLDIIAVYHDMQNQRDMMIQSRENGRKPQIWAILGPFCLNFGREIFFSKIGLCHFFRLIGYFDAKSLRNPMIGPPGKLVME